MSSDWLLNEENRAGFQVDGAKVTFTKPPGNHQCTYHNAMYLGLCASEKKRYYWEFNCTGRASVGIAKKDAFADGYNISGCFFNGNLSDGGCLLVGEFGDFFSEGNRVGFILDLAPNELKIWIVQNDRPLGLAFVHSAPYASQLHPTVCFSESGTVEIKDRSAEAVDLDALLSRTDYPNKTVDGKYKLVRSIEKSSEKTLPNYELSLRKNENGSFYLSIHVINTVGGILTKKGEDAEGDLWEVEGLMSTLMAGDPQEMQNEFYLSNVIHNLKRIKFNENMDEVTITSPNATLHFKRFLPEKEPHESSTLLK